MLRADLPLLLIVALALSVRVACAAPAFDHTVVEMVVPLGAPTARAEFPFAATGLTPTALADVRVSCGCLAVAWPRTSLRPGERGTLTVVFTPGERTGRHEFSLFVFSAASAEPLELRLVTQVTPLLELSARYLAWTRDAPALERVVDLRAPPGVTLAEPDGDPALLRLRLARLGDHWRLHLQPLSTAQPLNTRVRLTATVAGQPPQVFTITARVP